MLYSCTAELLCADQPYPSLPSLAHWGQQLIGSLLAVAQRWRCLLSRSGIKSCCFMSDVCDLWRASFSATLTQTKVYLEDFKTVNTSICPAWRLSYDDKLSSQNFRPFQHTTVLIWRAFQALSFQARFYSTLILSGSILFSSSCF